MNYYMAPMEGLTTFIYRRAHFHHFGGFVRYFTPFIASPKLNARELREIDPENNKGMQLIPQVLTNKAEDFQNMAKKIREFGYDTINLNLGCPSGTVTARGRGAGALADLDVLKRFLDEIFEKCPMKISIKTRIGVESLEEWEPILEVYQEYPLKELIIHGRLLKEQYKGMSHPEAYQRAKEMLDCPLCFNGDVVSEETKERILQAVPDAQSIMIGRGILKDPGLLAALRRTEITGFRSRFEGFHEEIYEGYKSYMSGDLPILHKMKDLWTYMIDRFPGAEKELKKIRKANRLKDYEEAVEALLKN